MTRDQIYEVARKRAGYALARIADLQMNTWNKFPSPDSPKDIIMGQIAEAMNDALNTVELPRDRLASDINP